MARALSSIRASCYAEAAKIASTVPTVKYVSNKLEVVKELPEIIARPGSVVSTVSFVRWPFASSL